MPKHTASPSRTALLSRIAERRWAAVGLIVGLATVAFANGFAAPWVYDGSTVPKNPAIRQLWPPAALMSGSNRPVGLYSFAIDRAIFGDALWGYHATNLAIHAGAALVLFGLVRRTLRHPRVAEEFRHHGDGLALAATLIWLVHPLQTQSVTYLYQRFESLMGLFFLLTLYLFARAAESPRPRNLVFYAASIVACLLGMGTKEVMIAAPLLVVWYDRVFLSDSCRSLARRHGAYYLALYGILAALASFVLVNRGGYAKAGVLVFEDITPWHYALSQSEVVLHYLRLSFWPSGQRIDYAWPVAQSPIDVLPQLTVMLLLLAGTAWLIVRRPAWGFLAASFFLILAPTSSFLPIRDLAYEHRMYLPLASVSIAVVLLGFHLVHRWRRRATRQPGEAGIAWSFSLSLGLVLVALTTVTIARNRVYRSDIALWRDTATKAPHNQRAVFNLACALDDAGEIDEAIAWYRRALELDPERAGARLNLAKAVATRDPKEAVAQYERVLELQPDDSDVHCSYAALLAGLGRTREAIAHCRRALELDPDDPVAHVHMANLLLVADPHAAQQHAEAALEHQHDNAAAHIALGNLLSGQQPRLAARHYAQAIKIDPRSAEAHYNLANLMVAVGRIEAATAHMRSAVALRPGWREAEENLRILLGAQSEASRRLGEPQHRRPQPGMPQSRKPAR